MKKLKQAGFTLIELGIVVAIMTFMAAYLIKQQTQDARMLIANAQGQQLAAVRDGLYNYSLRNFMAVVNNTAVTGVAVTRAPTVVELSALNYIPGGMTNNGYYGAGYALNATPSPVACVVPNCNIFVEAHLTAPIRDPFSGSVDGPALGEAVKTIGADGGASFMVPGTIEGQNGAWTLPNPMGAVAGILVARAGVGTQMDFAAYLRRDGTLPMTGNLDMGANTIGNIRTVVAGSACASVGEIAKNAAGAVLSCQGGIYKTQGSAFWNDPVANLASLPVCNAASLSNTRMVQTTTAGGARAYSCNGASWQPISVDNAGNMTVPATMTVGKMQINDVAVEGTACTPNGLVARDSVGVVLSCKSAIWTSITNCGLGCGQTWRSVLGSRGYGGTYTNTELKPIGVNVGVNNGGVATSSAYVNGVRVAYSLGNTLGGYSASTLSFVVPPGGVYRVLAAGAGGNGITSWTELRQ